MGGYSGRKGGVQGWHGPYHQKMTSCHLLGVSAQLGKNSLSDQGEVEANELTSEWGGVRMLAPLSRNVGRKGRLETVSQLRDLYEGRDPDTFIRSEARPAEKDILRADTSNGRLPLVSTVANQQGRTSHPLHLKDRRVKPNVEEICRKSHNSGVDRDSTTTDFLCQKAPLDHSGAPGSPAEI